MNLPGDAVSYLDALRGLAAVGGKAAAPPLVHCYTFSRSATPEERLAEARERVGEALSLAPGAASSLGLTARTVRSVAPGKDMLCYEFELPTG